MAKDFTSTKPFSLAKNLTRIPQTVSRREARAVREKLKGSVDAEQGGVTLEDFEDGTREWPRFKRTHTYRITAGKLDSAGLHEREAEVGSRGGGGTRKSPLNAV